MDIFDLLTMLGGLALFLYGMILMGEGLSQASEGKLRHALGRWTDTTGKAVLTGTGITALIQSSSAVTVMAAGLADAGIIGLEQAAGIIMGANIGTTVTSWILGMAGVNASATAVRLLKPTSFSPILAIIGVVLLLYSKKDGGKQISSILVGFSILIFGMDTMCGAAEPLAELAEEAGIFTECAGPVSGVLVGMTLTAVIQSSSASVGILQALCLTGRVRYGTAIPVIMGQNIGTCVTAMLSGVGSGKNAKRAAWIHLYFNLIGTTLFLGGFYTLNAVCHFPFLEETADGFGIAFVHSVFNVCTTLLLFPFSGALVKLACLTVREPARPWFLRARSFPVRRRAASSALWKCGSVRFPGRGA